MNSSSADLGVITFLRRVPLLAGLAEPNLVELAQASHRLHGQ